MKNKYEIRGEVTAIILKSKKYGIKETLISTAKLERANELLGSWFLYLVESSQTFYVQGNLPKKNGKQEKVLLHRWVKNAPNGTHVDHFNHDGLNNTDGNLRIATYSENGQNRTSAMKNSKSGVRGVSWSKKYKKWIACFRVKGKQHHAGYFHDINEAEKAVIIARAKYMPYSQEASA